MDKYGSSYTNSYFNTDKNSTDKITAWTGGQLFGAKITRISYEDDGPLLDAFNIDWEHSKIQVGGTYVTSSAHLAYLIDWQGQSIRDEIGDIDTIPGDTLVSIFTNLNNRITYVESTYVTYTYLTNKLANTLSSYVTYSYLDNKLTNVLSSYVTYSYLDNKLTNVLSSYVTYSYLNNTLNSYTSLAYLEERLANFDLSAYLSKEEANEKERVISYALNDLHNQTSYLTYWLTYEYTPSTNSSTSDYWVTLNSDGEEVNTTYVEPKTGEWFTLDDLV